MQQASPFFLTKRDLHRLVRRTVRASVGAAGRVLPRQLKLKLARRSSKCGMLLSQDPPFIFSGYLGRYQLRVDARSASDRAIMAGSYEPETFQTIQQEVRPGMVCLDIGANTGALSVALCDRVGESGKVYCFEPGPHFFASLKQNMELNPSIKGRAVLVQNGLSDRESELFWNEDPSFPGNAFLFGKSGLRVPVTTLNQYFASGLDRLDFIKIDIEGMECEALKGGEEILRRFHPTILFESTMEFEVYRERPVRQELAEFLGALGYQFYAIGPQGLLPVQYPHFQNNTLAKFPLHGVASWLP